MGCEIVRVYGTTAPPAPSEVTSFEKPIHRVAVSI
jgi:hypothetical protein